MKKILLLLPLLLLLAGCLQFEQTINLKKDGSVTVSMTYEVPENVFTTMEATHQAISTWQRQKLINWAFNERAVRKFYDRPEHQVKVIVYKQYRKNGKRVAEIVVQAKHAKKAFAQGYFGKITMQDRALTLHVPQDLNDLPEKQIGELRKLCGDMTVSVEVITPKDITETNGYKRQPNKTFWKLTADGRGMDIFGKLSDPTVKW